MPSGADQHSWFCLAWYSYLCVAFVHLMQHLRQCPQTRTGGSASSPSTKRSTWARRTPTGWRQCLSPSVQPRVCLYSRPFNFFYWLLAVQNKQHDDYLAGYSCSCAALYTCSFAFQHSSCYAPWIVLKFAAWHRCSCPAQHSYYYPAQNICCCLTRLFFVSLTEL